MSKLVGKDWLNSSHKRAEDLFLTAAMLPVSIPALLVASAAIIAVDHVNPYFSQGRLGENDEPFIMRKLRTMPGVTEHITSSGFFDGRRSKLGGFLAKTRTDEAPQFWNVLMGDMSIVGYRALIEGDYERGQKILDSVDYEEMRRIRFLSKPGLIHLFGMRHPGTDFSTEKEAWQTRFHTEREYFMTASRQLDHEIMLGCAKVATQLFKLKPNEDLAA